MGISKIFAIAALAASLGACQAIPRGMSVAEYCANPDKAEEGVCQLNVEIDGQKTALSETNMSLRDARALAVGAQAAADRAQASADAAMAAANSASLREDQLFCETRTIQQTDTGTCGPGYTLMSCAQTRYTYRAGGLSFLREIDDKMCRFNDRVLEMRVRCCMAGADRAPSTMTDTQSGPGQFSTPGTSQPVPAPREPVQEQVGDAALSSF